MGGNNNPVAHVAQQPHGALALSAASVVGGLRGQGVKRESGDAGSPERPPGIWDLSGGRASPTELKKARISEGSSQTEDIVVISRNPAEDLPRPQGPPVAVKPFTRQDQ